MKREEWRLLDLEYDDPWMNLAVEEAIPRMVGKAVAPNTLRFWRNVNAVVIGRFQSPELEVNQEACKRRGVDVVRRFTGGGAVYQDLGNLNYAISVRKGHPLVPKDVPALYEENSRGVIMGLKALGLEAATFVPHRTYIEVNGGKISGISAALCWGAVFLHGTLLVDSNLEVLSEALSPPEEQMTPVLVERFKRRRSFPREVTTMRRELGRCVSMAEVKQALIHGFERAYRIKLINGSLMEEEGALAQRIYGKRRDIGGLGGL